MKSAMYLLAILLLMTGTAVARDAPTKPSQPINICGVPVLIDDADYDDDYCSDLMESYSEKESSTNKKPVSTLRTVSEKSQLK